jgi:hypothetical protein
VVALAKLKRAATSGARVARSDSCSWIDSNGNKPTVVWRGLRADTEARLASSEMKLEIFMVRKLRNLRAQHRHSEKLDETKRNRNLNACWKLATYGVSPALEWFHELTNPNEMNGCIVPFRQLLQP